MPALKNDFARFTIVNIDPDAPSRGPFIVTQNGTAPDDPKLESRIFVMAKDGSWLDMAALFGIPGEMVDALLFDTAQDVVASIEALTSKVVIRKLDINPQECLAHMAMLESSGGLRAAIRHLLDKREEHRRNA